MSETEAFARLAEEFCAWAEAPAGLADDEALKAHSYLARLYAAALELPRSDLGFQGDAPNEAAWQVVYRRFGALPLNYYSAVDPLTVPGTEFLTGDLADDLADIWSDITAGLVLYRLGKPEDAGVEWRSRFDAHWAQHATEALVALQSWRSRRLGS